MVRPAALLVVIAVGGLLVAACGGGGATTGTGPTNDRASYSAALKFANCMRSHGVTNFPDPGSGGGVQVPLGSNLKGPAFRSAAQACGKFGPKLSGRPPQLSAAQRRRLIAFSQCIRAHGMPNFPDPTFPASGGARIAGQGQQPNFNPQSPAFEHASAACGIPFK
jgi:hypothetical protein